MGILNITVYRTVDDEFYFRLKNIAGGRLLTSRIYFSLEKCIKEIFYLQMYRDFTLIEEEVSEGINYRFSMRTAYGKFIAKSPVYMSFREMLQDIQLVAENIQNSEVEDCSTLVRFFRSNH